MIHALLEAKLSYVEMARRLNRAGFKTARGGGFQATQVMRLAQRVGVIEPARSGSGNA